MTSARVKLETVIDLLKQDLAFIDSQATAPKKSYRQIITTLEASTHLSERAFYYLKNSQDCDFLDLGSKIDAIFREINKTREQLANQLLKTKDPKPLCSPAQIDSIRLDAKLKQITFYSDSSETIKENAQTLLSLKTQLRHLFSQNKEERFPINYRETDAYTKHHSIFTTYYKALLLSQKNNKKEEARKILEKMQHHFNTFRLDLSQEMLENIKKLLLKITLVTPSSSVFCCLFPHPANKINPLPIEKKEEAISQENLAKLKTLSKGDYYRFNQVTLIPADEKQVTTNFIFFDLDKTLFNEDGSLIAPEKLKKFFQDSPPTTKFIILSTRDYLKDLEQTKKHIAALEKHAGKNIFSEIFLTSQRKKHHAMKHVYHREKALNPLLERTNLILVDDLEENRKNCEESGFSAISAGEEGAPHFDELRVKLGMPSEKEISQDYQDTRPTYSRV